MSERIYAVIDDGVVVNTIVADDGFAALIAREHQAVLEITNLAPTPSIGWGYDNQQFLNPYLPDAAAEPEPHE